LASSQTPAPAAPAIPCTLNNASLCPAGNFCAFQFGECTGTGQCFAQPATTDCDPTVNSVVCGCDGKNYTNECLALASGVSLLSQGGCGAGIPNTPGGTGTTGGTGTPGSCIVNANCSGLAYCQYQNNQCPTTEGQLQGQCVNVPSSCSTDVNPVCGCDGLAYENSCKAQSNGISIAAPDSCFIPSPCNESNPCSSQTFCQWEFGDCGGNGFCVPQPLASTCSGVSNPVCGCDSKTYTNQCKADAAGVSALSNGSCVAATNGGGDDGTGVVSTSAHSSDLFYPIALLSLVFFQLLL